MPFRLLQLNSARKFVGEAAHTLNLSEALRRAGHTVVLGLREGHETFERARARGLDPAGFRMHSRWSPSRDYPDLKKIARLVREHELEMIHAHRGKDHWLAAMAVKLFGLGVPVVRTRHLTRPLKSHLANRWLAKRTARLVAVSRAVEDDVRSTGLYEGRLRRIPGGIDLDRFQRRGGRAQTRAEWNLPGEAPLAVCVARFAKVKAHPLLISAWKAVHKALPDAVLLLIGGGDPRERAQAEAKVKEWELTEAVRFLGKVDDGKIPALLEAADAGVLASVGSEGFSRAVLEYLALGLPVVGTRVGGIPDLVEAERSGKLVPPGDVPALAAALREVLGASPEQRGAWGQAGRERAQAAHAYPVWARAHEALYREARQREEG